MTLAVDANKHVFVGGQTYDPTQSLILPGGFATAPSSSVATDGYLLRFNEIGALTYGTYVGGFLSDGVYSVDTDGTGTVWVAGYTGSDGPNTGQVWTPGKFPIRGNTYQTTHPSGGTEGFVVMIDTNEVGDASLLLGTYIGGDPVHGIRAVDVDGAGYVYVAGTTSGAGTGFEVGGHGYRTTPQSSEAFLARFDPGLQVRLYATYIGGSGAENDAPDEGFSLAVDDHGHAWVAGGTRSTDFLTTANALKNALSGARDGFIVRIDTTLSGMASLVFSTLFGGDGDEYVYDLAVDPGGNAYIVGPVFSKPVPPHFPTSACTIRAQPGALNVSGWDGYLLRVGPAGTRQFFYGTFVGGAGYDEARGVALGAPGRAFVVGRTISALFPVTPGASQTTAQGGFDGFVAKVDTRCAGLADLSLTYTGPQVAPPGQPVTYTAVVSNAGPDPAWYASVLLYWPASATGVSASDPACLPAGPGSAYLVCDLSLEVGESRTFSLTFVPHGSGDIYPYAGTGGPWALIDPDYSNNTAGVTAVVREPAADLRVTYAGPTGSTLTGQPLTYTALVTNLGPDPSNVTLLQYRPSASINATASDAACQVTSAATMMCAIGLLAPGEKRGLTFTFTPQGAGDVWTSIATVNESPDDPDPSNNDALLTLTLREPTSDIKVTASGPTGTLATGQPLTYTAVVTNLGPDPSNVFVIQYRPMPSSGATASDPGCYVNPGSQNTTCSIMLAANESRTMSFTFTPQGTGTANAGITAPAAGQPNIDPNPSNNTKNFQLTLTPPGGDLSITSVSSTVAPAPYVPFTITFTVHNAGPATATNVLVTAKLTGETGLPGTGLRFLKAQPAGCVSKNMGNVTCPLFTLAAAASATIPIAVVSILPGTYVTTSAVAAAEPDPAMANNASTVTVTTPPNADLSILASASPSPAAVGQPITYTMTVANAGPSTATNVTATLAFSNGLFIPGALTFVSAPGCTLAAALRRVECTAASMAKGSSQTFAVTVTSGAAMTLGTGASVTAAETDLVPSNNAKSGLLVIAP